MLQIHHIPQHKVPYSTNRRGTHVAAVSEGQGNGCNDAKRIVRKDIYELSLK